MTNQLTFPEWEGARIRLTPSSEQSPNTRIRTILIRVRRPDEVNRPWTEIIPVHTVVLKRGKAHLAYLVAATAPGLSLLTSDQFLEVRWNWIGSQQGHYIPNDATSYAYKIRTKNTQSLMVAAYAKSWQEARQTFGD